MRAVGVYRGRRGARKRPRTGWLSLTPTERRIADLVVEGLSNPQIGERLYVSFRTVQTHLAHVFAKLGISSRARCVVPAGFLKRSGFGGVRRPGRSAAVSRKRP